MAAVETVIKPDKKIEPNMKLTKTIMVATLLVGGLLAGSPAVFAQGGPGGGGPGGGGFGALFGQPSPESDALQKAVDDQAPAGQLKTLIAKLQAVHKEKQAKLAQAQEDLRAVLTPRQEAIAILGGLLN